MIVDVAESDDGNTYLEFLGGIGNDLFENVSELDLRALPPVLHGLRRVHDEGDFEHLFVVS